MLSRRKESPWIAGAFLLLCAVSFYRQLSLRYLPRDPVRPVIVYIVYLLLLILWWVSVRNRVMQRSMRAFLLLVNVLMLLWVTTRFIQDSFFYRNIYRMRISGYLIVIPLVLIPLLGLYAAFGLGKAEDYRFKDRWYSLLVPAGFLIALMLTNEMHGFVFRPALDRTQPDLHFHPNIGILIIGAWALFLELARVFLLYFKSRELTRGPGKRKTPLFFSVLMLVFSAYYFASAFVVDFELIEYTVAMFFMEIMVWETCIYSGMVPVNTHYKEAFYRSTISMQIIDMNGQPFSRSAGASELSAELYSLLLEQKRVRTAQGQELGLHKIRGGYAVWQRDISQTAAVIDALERSAEKLEHEGELLRQEIKARSDEASVREQNRIYDLLSEEVGSQLALLQGLLEKSEWVEDKERLFRQICLVGTYVKRRCSLRLIELSDGEISNRELAICFRELMLCLEQMGIRGEITWDSDAPLAPELAIFALDVFEFFLEYERFAPESIQVIIESDTGFSVEVFSSAAAGYIPNEALQQINRQGYPISLHAGERGYRLTAGKGRGPMG